MVECAHNLFWSFRSSPWRCHECDKPTTFQASCSGFAVLAVPPDLVGNLPDPSGGRAAGDDPEPKRQERQLDPDHAGSGQAQLDL